MLLCFLLGSIESTVLPMLPTVSVPPRLIFAAVGRCLGSRPLPHQHSGERVATKGQPADSRRASR